MSSSANEFLTWLKTQIPLLTHMGLGELSFDGSKLILPAKLAPNVNDKGTGFGGSIATLATISGWCLTTLILKQHKLECDVMIKESSMQYLRPITADFYAEVAIPSQDEAEHFIATVEEKGRARFPLTVDIKQGEHTALTMQGLYVAIRRPL